VMVVVRGDHEVNEIKLAKILGAREVFLANDAEVRRVTNADPGFAGPVDFKGRVLIDREAANVADGVTGANETDHHFTHVTMGRDFQGETVDVRKVGEGDLCPKCASPLKAYRGIEGGHIFVLGTHYTAKMNANFLDEQGKSKPIVMGCYGIGVSRLVATAVEQHHDGDGIMWPMSIAPYQVIVTPAGKEDELAKKAQELYDALAALGIDVLLDDRDERPGVKFKDADLIGIPLRAVIGKRSLAEGKLELKARNVKEAEMIPLDGAAEVIAARVREARR
jgi:prolyl-tRNA synthetase